MEDKKHFFAVDLGATSGRTIIGTLADGKIELEELTRFDNNLIETGGHFYWDIYALYFEIIKGLKLVAQQGLPIRSIGIDTWGVDFVCVGGDGALLRNPIAYRDPHTFGMMEDYFEHAVSKEKVYDITGIQFMNFNSLFQLYTMRKNGDSALKNAEKILFVPDALSYMLTGKMVCEYTIASTSQMLDPRTKQLDEELLQSVGLARDNFGRMVNPATEIGVLTQEVQQMTGLGPVPVIAVAGHDTGSAVAAVPAKDEKFAYLSSGTWSLMGIETKNAIIDNLSYERNFTNRRGHRGHHTVPEEHLRDVALRALPQGMDRRTEVARRAAGGSHAAASLPVHHQPRRPDVRQPQLHGRSHKGLLPPDGPARTRGLRRDMPLHIRVARAAIPPGVQLPARNGLVPHRRTPHHRRRLAQRIPQPVHGQLARHRSAGRAAGKERP